MKRTKSARKIYERHHKITLGEELEVHHIIPLHAGGTDDHSNLIALTREEHRNEHLKRYLEKQDYRDLCAYHLLGNSPFDNREAQKIVCSEGGKVGGEKVKRLGLGICTANENLRSKWASLGGKVGGKVQYENGLGIHAQTNEERAAYASIGGKRGAFTQPCWQSKFGKRGGVKNKGFVWLTDGSTNIKYTKKQQSDKDIGEFLAENPSFKQGRTEPKRKCYKCGKVMSARAIGRFHNERCKNAKD
jgi:hypothetical protein